MDLLNFDFLIFTFEFQFLSCSENYFFSLKTDPGPGLKFSPSSNSAGNNKSDMELNWYRRPVRKKKSARKTPTCAIANRPIASSIYELVKIKSKYEQMLILEIS